MSQSWQTVLISLCTSLIVSLFTFILGLKSGKNQADRGKVQEIYKKIYAHFEDLRESIKKDKPKTWSNYKAVKTDLYYTQYVPIVAELRKNGDLLYIDSSIASKASDLEIKLMNFGSDESKSVGIIHQTISDAHELFADGWKYHECNNVDKTNSFETANPHKCNRHILADYRDWFNRSEIERLFSAVSDDCGMNFSYRSKTASFSLDIWPDSLNVPCAKFVEQIYELLYKNSTFSGNRNAKENYLIEIEKLNKKIAKKVKEPFSFWNTFFGAFADLFR